MLILLNCPNKRDMYIGVLLVFIVATGAWADRHSAVAALDDEGENRLIDELEQYLQNRFAERHGLKSPEGINWDKGYPEIYTNQQEFHNPTTNQDTGDKSKQPIKNEYVDHEQGFARDLNTNQQLPEGFAYRPAERPQPAVNAQHIKEPIVAAKPTLNEEFSLGNHQNVDVVTANSKPDLEDLPNIGLTLHKVGSKDLLEHESHNKFDLRDDPDPGIVLEEKRIAAEAQPRKQSSSSQYQHDLNSQGIYFIVAVAGCTAATAVGIVAAGFCWFRLHKRAKETEDTEYPAYGVTGPSQDVSPTGDRKLAQSAQMFHYQHQKQQMIAMERGSTERGASASDVESDGENEDGDYTVYECPGLAPTGEMEVKNPLFQDDPTPVTPAKR